MVLINSAVTMNQKGRLSDFSSLSVICSVDKFVKAVDAMNETVMVPSRLLNVDLSTTKNDVPEILKHSADPYSCYSVLNNVKNNLVWGLEDNEPEVAHTTHLEDPTWFSSPGTPQQQKKGHMRRISTVSMVSVVSTNSDTECERLSDGGDSGLDGEEIEPATDLTASLRTHLIGLQSCLVKLTDTAQFITEKYNEEISV